MSNIMDPEDFDEDSMPCTCACGNMFDHPDGHPCSGCKVLFCSDCVEEPWDECPCCSED